MSAKSKEFAYLIEGGLHRKFKLYAQRVQRKESEDNLPSKQSMFIDLTNAGDELKCWNINPIPYEKWQSTSPARDRVYVIVSSIFYLGTATCGGKDREYKSAKTCLNYFVHSARKEVGAHVFTDRSGRLRVIFCRVEKYKTEKDVRKGLGFTNVACIGVIYPTICTQTNPHGQVVQALVLGLRYRAYVDRRTRPTLTDRWDFDATAYGNESNPNGYRQYHRDGHSFEPIFCGGVCDLNERELVELHTEVMNPMPAGGAEAEERPKFALYVCAGAKLTVIDQYSKDWKDKQHNRTLIQQGGVVIVDDHLLITMSGIDNKQSWDEQTHKFKAFYKYHRTGEYTNKEVNIPVIFLGAHDSEYNSIAWELNIDRPELPERAQYKLEHKTKRTCRLAIPNGGHIVAIEDWRDGINEIMCRHRYERLHRMVTYVGHVTNQLPYSSQFEIPADDEMLAKILNVGGNRNITIPTESNLTTLPVEFNFYGPDPGVDLQKIRQSNCHPWAPPAYPPIKKDNDFYYIPQQNIGPCNFNQVYNWYERDNHMQSRGNYLTKEGFKFELQDHWEFEEYEWEWMESSYMPRDTIDCRLGVDGFYYRKTSNKFVKYKTKYYKNTRCPPKGASKTPAQTQPEKLP